MPVSQEAWAKQRHSHFYSISMRKIEDTEWVFVLLRKRKKRKERMKEERNKERKKKKNSLKKRWWIFIRPFYVILMELCLQRKKYGECCYTKYKTLRYFRKIKCYCFSLSNSLNLSWEENSSIFLLYPK